MSESTYNFVGCGVVTSLVRSFGEWLRAPCWRGHAPSETSTNSCPSRHSRTFISATTKNATLLKYDRSLARLSEKSEEQQRDSSCSTVGATSSTSCPASRRPRRRVSAETPSREQASGSSEATPAPNNSLQQPVTVAFSSTSADQVLPSPNPSTPAEPLSRSDSKVLLSSRIRKSGGVDVSDQDNDFSELETACLLIHNDYREKHDVPPLTLNKQMCGIAKGMAISLGMGANTQLPSFSLRDLENKQKMCEFAKSMATALCAYTQLPALPERKYGEIILVAKSTEPVSIYDACHRWYDQSCNYKFGVEPKASKSRKNNKCNFTQMIWRGTRELGVGMTHVDGTTAIVALYYPAGNVAGQFAYNCPRPRYQVRCPLEDPASSSTQDDS